jgi:hypothetical protein
LNLPPTLPASKLKYSANPDPLRNGWITAA